MSAFSRRVGEGESLFIHCALAHSGVLEPLMCATRGGVAYDLPGHGKSTPWDETGDYQAQAVAWGAELMTGPGAVFGHSFGGTVALRLAVERPDLVTRLVLVEPVFFAAIRLHDPRAFEAHEARFAPIVEAYEAGDMHLMAERFTTMWGGASWEGLPARFKDGLAAQMPLIIAQGRGIGADSGGVFNPGRLEALDIPVTLIRGAGAEPSVVAIHRVLLGLLPNAREEVIAGAGHMSPMTHTAEVAALSQL
ncbi:MAG: alpha/beta hydrolase [Pseudomonadota bacterium]